MTDNNKPKLELNWVGKNNPDYDIANIEPRILEEDPTLSNCANDPHTENMIIHGDNLLALKALLPEYEGKVKCIYIDPPYNTGNAFEHYDDNVEHSTWLSLMKPRLELLRMLLREDGILAIQIDDNEFAKLFIMLSEIFDGQSKLKTIAVKMSEATGVKMASVNEAGSLPKLKEYIILAGKSGIKNLTIEKIPKGKWDYEYKTVCLNVTKDELEIIKSTLSNDYRTLDEIDLVDSIASKITFAKLNEIALLEIGTLPTEDWLAQNAFRIVQFATMTGGALQLAIAKKKTKDDNTSFSIITPQNKAYLIRGDFNDETRLPRCKFLFADLYLEVHPGDFWHDIKTTGLDNEGSVDFPKSKKPEKLIKRIIGMSSKVDDLVLDSFLGSGTTAAVAHKMGRKYIGIEMGEHAYTHCKVRMDKVIDGSDQGGVSKAVDWKGGGAYKFYELAPSFIVTDEFGNPVIDTFYNDVKLIKALCKLLNFSYAPSKTEYWKHGVGQGKNFLYVTTQLLSCAMIQQIAAHLAVGETLIICPKKYEPGADKIDSRITVKKIPKSVLKACHFGKKEYLLPIKETAIEEFEDEMEDND